MGIDAQNLDKSSNSNAMLGWLHLQQWQWDDADSEILPLRMQGELLSAPANEISFSKQFFSLLRCRCKIWICSTIWEKPPSHKSLLSQSTWIRFFIILSCYDVSQSMITSSIHRHVSHLQEVLNNPCSNQKLAASTWSFLSELKFGQGKL